MGSIVGGSVVGSIVDGNGSIVDAERPSIGSDDDPQCEDAATGNVAENVVSVDS